jgi:heme iron utilization protein
MSFLGPVPVRDTCAMPHEPRLTTALRALLASQRVAALGTLGADGLPFVSMVPFAVDPAQACVVIHVSGLAPHTRNLQTTPQVSVLVMQAEAAGEPVHALPRVTLDGAATVLQPETPAWRSAREAYLARFPEAEPMTQLGDFRFVAIAVGGARQVAGFGAARSLDAEAIDQALRPPGG